MIGAAGQLLLVLLALIAVIGMIFGAAWLARRYGGVAMLGASARMRTLAVVHVGQRERVVLLDVQGVQLLLGVAAGSVRRLHTFPPAVAGDAAPVLDDNGAEAQASSSRTPGIKDAFAMLLKRALGHPVPPA